MRLLGYSYRDAFNKILTLKLKNPHPPTGGTGIAVTLFYSSLFEVSFGVGILKATSGRVSPKPSLLQRRSSNLPSLFTPPPIVTEGRF